MERRGIVARVRTQALRIIHIAVVFAVEVKRVPPSLSFYSQYGSITGVVSSVLTELRRA